LETEHRNDGPGLRGWGHQLSAQKSPGHGLLDAELLGHQFGFTLAALTPDLWLCHGESKVTVPY
jgi:hypothetical protein